MAIHGTLDVFVCLNGRFINLELKKSRREKLEPLQQYNADRVRAARGLAFKATPENWDSEVLPALKRIAYST